MCLTIGLAVNLSKKSLILLMMSSLMTSNGRISAIEPYLYTAIQAHMLVPLVNLFMTSHTISRSSSDYIYIQYSKHSLLIARLIQKYRPTNTFPIVQNLWWTIVIESNECFLSLRVQCLPRSQHTTDCKTTRQPLRLQHFSKRLPQRQFKPSLEARLTQHVQVDVG